uniref:Uncharacterized protein n=1 Tax=Romanomermis culicivorax TaxID=13658 RepID=A0A915KQ61_ROMCU
MENKRGIIENDSSRCCGEALQYLLNASLSAEKGKNSGMRKTILGGFLIVETNFGEFKTELINFEGQNPEIIRLFAPVMVGQTTTQKL